MEIIFDNVSFTYNIGFSNEKEVLKNIDLKIEEGKIYGITGKSGSGKTTLVQLIQGIIKPTSGLVSVNGILPKYSDKRISFVTQFTEDFLLEDNVYKEIKYNIGNNNYKIINALKMVGLSDEYLNRDSQELSLGEKKLLSIAATLAHAPKVLILDEPGLGLDRINKEKLIKTLNMINQKHKVTIIIVSHDINLLNHVIDNLIILNNGKILVNEKKEDVYKKVSLLKKNDIEIPTILEFINIVEKEKNIKLGTYHDVRDLIKAVYRNV